MEVSSPYVPKVGEDETMSEFKPCINKVVGVARRVQLCKREFAYGAEGPTALELGFRKQSVECMEAFRIASPI